MTVTQMRDGAYDFDAMVLTTYREGEVIRAREPVLIVSAPGDPIEYSYGVPVKFTSTPKHLLHFQRLTFHDREGHRADFDFWAPPDWSQPRIMQYLIDHFQPTPEKE